jgi:hypothetical protein
MGAAVKHQDAGFQHGGVVVLDDNFEQVGRVEKRAAALAADPEPLQKLLRRGVSRQLIPFLSWPAAAGHPGNAAQIWPNMRCFLRNLTDFNWVVRICGP